MAVQSISPTRPPTATPKEREPQIWDFGAHCAALLLAFACLSPLASVYGGLPDVSGAEAGLALAAWFLAIVSTVRLHGIDAVILLLLAWAAISAATNDVPIMAAVLYASLLSAPFTTLRIIMHSGAGGQRSLRRMLVALALAQVAMFCMQLVTYSGIDDLKGTFIGTQYGEHVGSFLVLVAAAIYAIRRPRMWRGWWAIVGALGFAYLADSKIALMYFLIVSVGYAMLGTSIPKGHRNSGAASRLLVGAVGGVVAWAVYTGTLGNIAIAGYVEQSTTTGGGKIAVTKLITNPGGRFWSQENYLLGAGPAQTVSRTAGLTTPTPSKPVPPAARLGIPQSEYYTAFEHEAAGYGYISASSATKAASSFLGIWGDLGLVGLVIYGWGYLLVYRWIAVRLGGRSWPAMAWVGLLIPGFLGEWLEFPSSCMFLVCAAGWLAMSSSGHDIPNVGAEPSLASLGPVGNSRRGG